MFALMVDDNKDVSRKEQVIVIIVQYLQRDEIREDFLHFTLPIVWMPNHCWL